MVGARPVAGVRCSDRLGIEAQKLGRAEVARCLSGLELPQEGTHRVLQVVLIAPVFADDAVGLVTADIEALLDVVVPDDPLAEDADGPEAAALVAPRR